MTRWEAWGRIVNVPHRIRWRAYKWITRHFENDYDEHVED